ncbi:hypothetical protein BDZ91DRAFT_788329 [Kalaharituber pfeilii]|nr:hypothetical protein BDZ91DRAFT_788329 [Kalaharituber pfeilii]
MSTEFTPPPSDNPSVSSTPPKGASPSVLAIVKLALLQAEIVRSQLLTHLPIFGVKALCARELQQLILDGKVDVIVHSFKGLICPPNSRSDAELTPSSGVKIPAMQS